jgi:nucleoside-diphosphate-sugar epimerase
MAPHLFVFGPGYTAQHIMARAKLEGWHVSATYRDEEKKTALEVMGYKAVAFNGARFLADTPVTHILCSVSPPEGGDPVLETWTSWLEQLNELHSIHYLSSTNVYGNHDGAWVDENSVLQPSLERGQRRVVAENAWHTLGQALGVPAFVYRLAGIYGPGRNVFRSLKSGKSRRVIRDGQVFGRIHVSDIESAFWQAANSDHQGGTFNLADDLPTPPQELIEAAAKMLGIPAPPEEPFETATLSPMARSFYMESKRVKNNKIKNELGFTFQYPTYHEGLAALFPEEKET